MYPVSLKFSLLTDGTLTFFMFTVFVIVIPSLNTLNSTELWFEFFILFDTSAAEELVMSFPFSFTKMSPGSIPALYAGPFSNTLITIMPSSILVISTPIPVYLPFKRSVKSSVLDWSI